MHAVDPSYQSSEIMLNDVVNHSRMEPIGIPGVTVNATTGLDGNDMLPHIRISSEPKRLHN